MPKPMMLTINVEEIALGKVFRTLDGMPGVVSINFHGSGPKPRSNGAQRKGGAQTVPCIILGTLIDAGKSLGREDLAPAVIAAKKAVSSIPDALNKLAKSRLIKRHGPNADRRYTSTAAGSKYYHDRCAVQPPEGDE